VFEFDKKRLKQVGSERVELDAVRREERCC